MKTLKNKLYAVALLICGYLPVLIDKDATALVFFAGNEITNMKGEET